MEDDDNDTTNDNVAGASGNSAASGTRNNFVSKIPKFSLTESSTANGSKNTTSDISGIPQFGLTTNLDADKQTERAFQETLKYVEKYHSLPNKIKTDPKYTQHQYEKIRKKILPYFFELTTEGIALTQQQRNAYSNEMLKIFKNNFMDDLIAIQREMKYM